jgi:dTDP-glucose 4,6-dehydratase
MTRLNGKRVLVTGGAGFIGSHFVELLLRTYPDVEVITLDKLTYAGTLDNLRAVMDDPRHRFVQGDVTRRADVEAVLPGVQWVFHFAAETHVDRSLYDPGRFLETDVWGTFEVLEAARRHGVEGFVHVSTDEVYGSVDEGLAHEQAPLEPSSPYSASKAAADRLAHAYAVTFGLPVLIVRPCNAYGPRQFPEKLIPFFIVRALQDQPLPLYGDGQNVRDWLYVEDLCEAIRVVAERGTFGTVYNIGAGNLLPNIEVAHRILALLGKPTSLIRRVPDRPGHDRRYAMDWGRIRRLGWRPETDFDRGLRVTVEWYRTHPERWQNLESDEAFRRFYEQHYGPRWGGDPGSHG